MKMKKTGVSIPQDLCSKEKIPPDLVFQILRELPVKALARFRAVSRLWCSIIDDPDFIDSHRTRSYTRPGGIRILSQYSGISHLNVYSTDPDGGSILPSLTLPVHRQHNDCRFRSSALQSVDGLVLWENSIFNLSTRQSIDLPPVIVNFQFDIRQGRERSLSNRCNVNPEYLLGFDPSTKTYKVVNICRFNFIDSITNTDTRRGGRLEYRIFTMGTRRNLWRDLDPFPQNVHFDTWKGLCCIDGVIFCLGSSETDNNKILVAFEVGPEKFRVIPVPEESIGTLHLIQLGDHLSMIDDLLGIDGTITIWILEDYHKQKWKKRASFVNSAQICQIRRSTNTPMTSMHTNEVLFYSYEFKRDREIRRCFYYDVETGKLRMVRKLTKLPKEFRHRQGNELLDLFAFTKHVECLFRLKELD